MLEIIKDYFEKSYSRFYIEFGRILNEIDVDKLTQVEFQKYQIIIDSLIKEKAVYNTLILKLKTNNNYYVKYMVNKYL